MIARNNALRHGLARAVTSDPAAANEVELEPGKITFGRAERSTPEARRGGPLARGVDGESARAEL